jgi:hypothetical protein
MTTPATAMPAPARISARVRGIRLAASTSAPLGMLLVTLLAPGAPVVVKMLAATACALAGTALFPIPPCRRSRARRSGSAPRAA